MNGVEILTNPDYISLFPIAREIGLMTNGKVIADNSSIIKKLKNNGIEMVSISFHFGSDVSTIPFDMIERAISLLRSNNIIVEIMTTISKQNYRHVERICEEDYKLGASKLYFTNYIKEVAQNGNSLVLSPDEIKEFADNLTFIRTNYAKDQLYIYRSELFDSMYYLTKDTFQCYLPTEDIVITPKKVYPCVFCISETYQIGYLEGDKILPSKKAIASLPQGQGCRACNIFNYGLGK